ncbi:aspartyl/asparaginyl beta-hydroxylase domain-containing protein [Aquimarina brevivitae]|uniref:Aspartyl/asparaginyl beta-hydroxylase n=1 Tax=Aquimarina brevivitae TaxID=323412 RepID=A0A4Q7PGQ1_9FLAO|nr:aspartyl/asparaginyl beta-hydroxylase domain-containing protein [Aquimarina brevivitae]RZS99713.1 aspartyl/asparaginyl beta-hydroxylase [Aquimarina brevivitae]
MHNDVIKLPLFFSTSQLLKDLDHCKKYDFTDHYNQQDYSGTWTSIALRSSSGNPEEVFATASSSNNYKDTELLTKCLYFKEIIEGFKCPKLSIRLLNLSAGSLIKTHTDHNLSYEDKEFRIHIPITTNDLVDFTIGDHKVEMLPGECWYGDFTLPHSVENHGNTDRVHLVLDCVRNEWTDTLFKKAGYDFAIKKEHNYDPDTKAKMIEELQKMNTPTANQLITNLQKET